MGLGCQLINKQICIYLCTYLFTYPGVLTCLFHVHRKIVPTLPSLIGIELRPTSGEHASPTGGQ
jgi:hypothetical protein